MKSGIQSLPPVETPALPEALARGLNSREIPSLNGLRALAAFLVVFYHAGLPVPGGMGVLAFFVLSGFLITWLLLKEEDRNGAVSLKAFYIRRSLRIFPAFYVFWLLQNAAMLMARRPHPTGQSIAAFFYVSNYYQAILGDPDTGLSHAWSLGIEEQFYLLWPLGFILLKQNRARLYFLAATVAAIWIHRELLVFVFHADQGYIYEAFDTRADHLLTGCLLAVALREARWIALWRRIQAASWLAWPVAALLAISGALNWNCGTTYRDAIGFVVDPLLVAVLIVATITHPGTGLGAAFNWRWVRYLGIISYPIYLYHMIALRAGGWYIPQGAEWLKLPAGLAAVVLVASASYWIVERPILRIKDRFSAKWEAAKRARK